MVAVGRQAKHIQYMLEYKKEFAKEEKNTLDSMETASIKERCSAAEKKLFILTTNQRFRLRLKAG